VTAFQAELPVQIGPQPTTGLDVQGPVDRLVTHPFSVVITMLDEPVKFSV
jgi:hypothetical protein